MTTDAKTEQAAAAQAPAAPARVRRLRASLTDAGATARRRLRRLRGRTEPAFDPPAPEVSAIANGDGAGAAEPAGGRGFGLWRAIGRARLAVVLIVALVQVVLALVTWRIRGSRTRRRGQPGEEDALEALGEKLGGLAGSIDASQDG